MKYLTLIIFLFLTLVASAQLNVEEIAYIPARSGYYNNLVVKGDVFINNLETAPIDIQSYGSFLDTNILNSGFTTIGELIVSTNTYVALNNAAADNFPWHGGYQSYQNGYFGMPPHKPYNPDTPIILNIQSGNISIQQKPANTNLAFSQKFMRLKAVNDFASPKASTIAISHRAENLSPEIEDWASYHRLKYVANQDALAVKNAYIMGMKVPFRNGGYNTAKKEFYIAPKFSITQASTINYYFIYSQ